MLFVYFRFNIKHIVLSYQNHVKSNFILDLKVRFKGGVLSPLFYQSSTRLRYPAGNSPRQPREAARRRGVRPAHLANGDGEGGGRGWIVCLGGEGEGKLGCPGRALGSAMVDGRDTARISLEVIY